MERRIGHVVLAGDGRRGGMMLIAIEMGKIIYRVEGVC